MGITVDSLKLGSRLMMGEFSIAPSMYAALPIVWLKASKDNVFISESVIAYMPFDSPERNNTDVFIRRHGNNNYELSNLLQFLNADGDEWFSPTHQFDAAGDEFRRSGFLSEFKPYELASMASRVGLPSVEEIMGPSGQQFQLFHRKGKRAKATPEVCRRHWIGTEQFAAYWTRDPSSMSYAKCIATDCSAQSALASTYAGVRPIVKLNPNALIHRLDDIACYHLLPFEVRQPVEDLCTDEELLSFLGLN